MNEEVGLTDAVTQCPGCGKDVLLMLRACPKCGAAASTSSAFIGFRRPDGSTGMIDQPTLAFLRSELPGPSQKDLDELLGSATRAKVSELVFRDHRGEFEPLFEIDDAAGICALCSALRIQPQSFGHLMTNETHRIECFDGDRPLGTLLLVETDVVRWPGRWKPDALIANCDAVADFFASRGDMKPREQLKLAREEDARRAAEDARWERSWDAATPPGLALLVSGLSEEVFATEKPVCEKAMEILADLYHTREAQILSLLTWLGHGLGPWSGFPSVETAPQCLLEAFGDAAVIVAIQECDLNEQQLEGAARFLCRWIHPKQRPHKQAGIPEHVRVKLWSYLEATGHADKIARAKRRLGPDARSSK